MEVIGITSAVENSKRTVNNIKNHYVAPSMTGKMTNELNMSSKCNAAEYISVARLLIIIGEAAEVCKHLKKTNIGRKVTGYFSDKCKKITENETVKGGVDWVKDKYSKVTENPVVKKCRGFVKSIFGTETKDV